MSERLFYVGISVATRSSKGLPEAIGSLGADVIVHVYVKAIDSTYANAAASDICSERGLEFRSFIYLANEETEDTVHQGEEHRTAFCYAMQHGLAYVIASVFDCEHHQIKMTQFD